MQKDIDNPISGHTGRRSDNGTPLMTVNSIKFAKKVAMIVAAIPPGKVATYGDIAALAGSPAHSRLVGKVLAHIGMNSDIPCHRVVNAQGRPAPHWHGQLALLIQEGIHPTPAGLVNLRTYRWRPCEDF